MQEFKQFLDSHKDDTKFITNQKNQFGIVQVKSSETNINPLLILQSTEYFIAIKNSIAKIQLQQIYTNQSNHSIDIDFFFSIDSSSCFDAFSAEYGEKIIKGVIQEKIQAQTIFEEEQKKGNLVTLANKEYKQNDIMKIKICNLPAQKQLKINFSYLQFLEVCVNKFRKLRIPLTLIKRYQQNLDDNKKQVGNKEIPFLIQKGQYIMDISVDIECLEEITFIQSPTHKINIVKNQKIAKIQLQNSNQISDRDFILLFKDTSIHKPQLLLTENTKFPDYPYCLSMSFFPEWNEICNDGDAYQQFIEDNQIKNNNNNFNLDLMKIQGEYIFLLDCSGSMSGNRIVMAKEALVIFLKSLPLNSYFNVIKFGTTFNYLFRGQSVLADETNISKALNLTKQIKADLGGTDIYSPLKDLFKQSLINNYPRYVFLITDGAIENEQIVIEQIQKNNSHTIICTLGIGSGCSTELIKEGAKAGKGLTEFIVEGECNMNQKVISLLQYCLSPYLQNFNFDYDSEIVEMMTPNINNLKFLRKNEQLQLFIFLKKEFKEKQSTTFSLTYYDQIIQKQFEYSIQVDLNQLQKDQEMQNQIYKIGIFNLLKNIVFDIKMGIFELEDVILQKQEDIKSKCLQLAIDHQILTEQTAFLAVLEGEPINDIQWQEKKKIEIQPCEPASFQSLTQEQIEEFKEAFDLFCTDKSGTITIKGCQILFLNKYLQKEFGQAMKALGCSNSKNQIQEMVNNIDCDGNGTIDFQDFLSVQCQQMKDTDSESEILEAFKIFDKNGSGCIPIKTLANVMTQLGEKLTDDEINEMTDYSRKDYNQYYFKMDKLPNYLKKINKFPKFIRYSIWKYKKAEQEPFKKKEKYQLQQSQEQKNKKEDNKYQVDELLPLENQQIDIYLQVILLQKSEGFWQMNENILAKINFAQDKTLNILQELINNNLQKEITMTIIVLIWLTNNYLNKKDEWILIEQKALSWLKGLKIDYKQIYNEIKQLF